MVWSSDWLLPPFDDDMKTRRQRTHVVEYFRLFFNKKSHYGDLMHEFRFNLYTNSKQNDGPITLQAYIRDIFVSYFGGGSAVLNKVSRGFSVPPGKYRGNASMTVSFLFHSIQPSSYHSMLYIFLLNFTLSSNCNLCFHVFKYLYAHINM
jgi:hypothetical protein